MSCFCFHIDRFGLGQSGRIPGSVNAMRVLSTSTDLEAAVADALVRITEKVESQLLKHSFYLNTKLPSNQVTKSFFTLFKRCVNRAGVMAHP